MLIRRWDCGAIGLLLLSVLMSGLPAAAERLDSALRALVESQSVEIDQMCRPNARQPWRRPNGSAWICNAAQRI